MVESEEKIKTYEYELRKLKNQLEKCEKERQLLKDQNNVLINTSTKMALEMNVLQKNYENFKDIINNDSLLLESNISADRVRVKKIEVDNFLVSLTKALKLVVKNESVFNKEVSDEILTELEVNLAILNDFLEEDKISKNDILIPFALLFNKKNYKAKKNEIEELLNLNLLDKKNYVKILLEIFESDKEEIFEDNLITKKIRKIHHLNLNQKILLSEMTEFYLKINFEFLKNLCRYFSNDDLCVNFKEELFEEIVNFSKKHKFSFLKSDIELNSSDLFLTSSHIVQELKELSSEEKKKILIDFDIKEKDFKSRIINSFFKDFVHPTHFNFEFENDKGKFTLPSSNLTEDRLELKVLFDIKKTEMLRNNSRQIIDKVYSLMEKIIKSLMNDEDIDNDSKLSFEEKNILKAFEIFSKDITKNGNEKNKALLEKVYFDFVSKNLNYLKLNIERFKNLFVSKINNQLKGYLLKYFEVQIDMPEKDQNLINFILNDDIEINPSKIFKTLIWIKWNLINVKISQILIDKISKPEKFDLILQNTFIYVNKITIKKSFSKDLKNHYSFLDSRQKEYFFVHFSYLENNKQKFEDSEDIFLYIKNIAYLPYQFRTLLFVFVSDCFYITKKPLPNNEKGLIEILEHLNENYDDHFKEKMIKEYCIMEDLVKDFIYDCFLLMIRKENFNHKLKKIKKLGKDVFKLACVILHFLEVYLNSLQNIEEDWSSKNVKKIDFEKILASALSMEIENWFIQEKLVTPYERLFINFNASFLTDLFNFYRLDYESDFFKTLSNYSAISFENKKSLSDLNHCLVPYKKDLIKKAQEGKNVFLSYIKKELLPALPYYTLDYLPKALIKDKLKLFSFYELEFFYECLEEIFITENPTEIFDCVLDRIDRFDLREENKRNLMRYLVLSIEQINLETYNLIKTKIPTDKNKNSLEVFINFFLSCVIVSDWEDEDVLLGDLRDKLNRLSHKEKQNLLDKFLDSNLIDFYKDELLNNTRQENEENPTEIFNDLNQSKKLINIKNILKNQIYQLELSSFQKKSEFNFDINEYNNLKEYYQDALEIIIQAYKETDNFVIENKFKAHFQELNSKRKMKILMIGKLLFLNEKFQSINDIKDFVGIFFEKDEKINSNIIFLLFNEIYNEKEEFLRKIEFFDFDNSVALQELFENTTQILGNINNRNKNDFKEFDSKMDNIKSLFFRKNIIEKLEKKKISLAEFFKKTFELLEQNFPDEKNENDLINSLKEIFEEELINDIKKFVKFCFYNEKYRQLFALINSEKSKFFKNEELWEKLSTKIFIKWENDILDKKLEKIMYLQGISSILEKMDKEDLERFFNLGIKVEKENLFEIFNKNNKSLEEVMILTLIARFFSQIKTPPVILTKNEILNILINPKNIFFKNIFESICKNKKIDYQKFFHFLQSIPETLFGSSNNYDFIFHKLNINFENCQEQEVLLLLEFLFLTNHKKKEFFMENLKNNKIIFESRAQNTKSPLLNGTHIQGPEKEAKIFETFTNKISNRNVQNYDSNILNFNNQNEIEESSYTNNFSQIDEDYSESEEEEEKIENPAIRKKKLSLIKKLQIRIFKKENLEKEAKIVSKINSVLLEKEAIIKYARNLKQKINFTKVKKSVEEIQKIENETEEIFFNNKISILKKEKDSKKKTNNNFKLLKKKMKSVKRLNIEFKDNLNFELPEEKKKIIISILKKLKKSFFKFYVKINLKNTITNIVNNYDVNELSISRKKFEKRLFELQKNVDQILMNPYLDDSDILSIKKKYKDLKIDFYHLK